MKKIIQFDFSTVITTAQDISIDCSYVSFVNEGETDIIIDGNYTIPPGMERVFETISDIHKITGVYSITFGDEAASPKCVVILGKETKTLYDRKVKIKEIGGEPTDFTA